MKNKTIVITGASGGIGAELARQLGAQGHNLVLAARRENELSNVANQIGKNAIAVVADVKNRSDVENIKASALKKFPTINVWVNNAGRGIRKNVLELTDDDVDEIIAVNIKSAIYGMQVIMPYFMKRGEGHLLNISSFLGKVPIVPFRSIYSAAKAALNSLTSNLRMDLGDQYPNIHVTTVMPGGVMTDFQKNALGGPPPIPPSAGSMNAQTAEQAAAAIVSVIENPRAEIYTNPALADIGKQYHNDIAVFEEGMRKRG